MTALPPAQPAREPDPVTRFASQLPPVLRQIQEGSDKLIASEWDEAHRKRVFDMAAALADASARLGLEDITGIARSITYLARLTREEALPLRSALLEKFRELLKLARLFGSEYADRHTAGG